MVVISRPKHWLRNPREISRYARDDIFTGDSGVELLLPVLRDVGKDGILRSL